MTPTSGPVLTPSNDDDANGYDHHTKWPQRLRRLCNLEAGRGTRRLNVIPNCCILTHFNGFEPLVSPHQHHVTTRNGLGNLSTERPASPKCQHQRTTSAPMPPPDLLRDCSGYEGMSSLIVCPRLTYICYRCVDVSAHQWVPLHRKWRQSQFHR
jgi:hypothetical protein